MPYTRVCLVPGCPELQERDGRCEVHARAADRKRGRPNKTARYGRGWDKKRKRYLRAHPLCAHCGRLADEVDHIMRRGLVPKNQDPDDWSNLQSLCSFCHRAKSARER